MAQGAKIEIQHTPHIDVSKCDGRDPREQR
jgi:hypothetical protein